MLYGKYNLIDTEEKLKALDQYLFDKEGTAKFSLLAFDTETNGLLFFKNVPIGFSLAINPKIGFYIPFLTWKPDLSSKKTRSINKVKREVFTKGCLVDIWTNEEYSEDVTPEQYKPPLFIIAYMKKWLTRARKLLMHNAPFDCCIVKHNLDIDLADHLLCCTYLLKHFIYEEPPHALKAVKKLWQKELGIDADQVANQEQLELGESVIKNGGIWNARTKHVWRGSLEQMAKYAADDATSTFGIFEVEMQKLTTDYKPHQVELFFEKEIMPLCREVVIPMRLGGVYIDVPYFEDLKKELVEQINKFEDQTISVMGDLLEDFSIGDSIDEAVSKKKLVEKFIELEGLTYPTLIKKGEEKKSLAKKAVEDAYKKEPHWVWGFLLGENEIKYSEAKQKELKEELYQEIIGRRYRFNSRSDAHLRWLLFDKLGNDKKSVPQTDSATASNPIPSCNAEALEDHFLKKYDFVKPLMMFRKLADLLSNYVEKAVVLHHNGWLYMEMDQAGTTSGRFACRGGFNLQTLLQVEELGSCPKCESKDIQLRYEGRLLANIKCKKCNHFKENIICYSVVKKGFIAPKGYKIVNSDFIAAEPKCFAFMSGDSDLKDIYKKNLDMYSKVYCDVEDAYDKYSADPKASNFLKKAAPAKRKMTKPVVLGVPYGARGGQVAYLMGLKKKYIDRKTGKEKEVVDVEAGTQWRNKYLGRYKDLQKYMEQCEIECITKGYVETILGRRRHYKYAPFIHKLITAYGISKDTFLDIKRKDLNKANTSHGLDYEGLQYFSEHFGISYFRIKEKGYWAYIRALYKNELDNAKNIKIQGLAGHITNRSMLDTARLFRQNSIDGSVRLQCHDEVGCYALENQAEQAAHLLKKGMEENEFAKLLDIPMEAEPIICDNLKDSK